MKALGCILAAVLMAGVVACTSRSADGEGERFRFSVALRADYTDNRDAWEDEIAEENFDFYVIPRLDIVSQGEQTVLDLFYAPSFRYRTDPSPVQNDTELLHSLGLNVGHKFTPRLTGRLYEQFDYTDDPAISDEGSTVREDRSYILNRTGAGLEFLVGRRTTVEAGGAYKLKRYDETAVAATSDEDRLDGTLTLRHYLTKTFNLRVYAAYSLFGYDSPADIQRDFDSAVGAVGVDNQLSQNLSVGALVGAQQQMYKDAGIDDGTSPFVTLYARGSTTPSLRLALEGTHAVRDADAYPYASQEYTEGRAKVDWDLSPRLTLSLNGTYRYSQYKDVAPSAAILFDFLGLETDGNETTIDTAATLAFKVSNQSTVRLVQRYENVDSDVSVDFTKNTTSLAFTQEF